MFYPVRAGGKAMNSVRAIGLTLSIGLVLVTGWAASRAWSQSKPPSSGQSEHTELTYPQLYVGPDGETHFRDVKVPLTLQQSAPPAPPYSQSALQPATAIKLVVFPPNWGVHDRDHGIFHNASARRFIFLHRGVMWTQASDGETREFRAGDIVEVLDVAPSKGHIAWTDDGGAEGLFTDHP